MMAKVTRKQKRDKSEEINFFEEFLRIQKHFFKEFISNLGYIKDNRHQSYIEYGTDIIFFVMIMKNITALQSMNQMTAEFNKDNCISNVAKTLGYQDFNN